MAYTIIKSDNTPLTTILDGNVDNSTSLNLIGKGFTNFGTKQNDNFVWLLENFAYNQEPLKPVTGQLWFDTTTGIMRPLVNDGSSWRPLAVALYSPTSTASVITAKDGNPSSFPLAANRPGDFWFKSDDQQLYVQTTSSGYVMVGPERAPGFLETKMRSTSIADSRGVKHAVIETLVDGELVSIISNRTFATTATISANGFPTVYRGVTFKNYNAGHRYLTTSTDVGLYGINSFLDSTYPQSTQPATISSQWSFTDGLGIGSVASTLVNDGTNNLSIASAGGNVSVFVNGATKVASLLQEGIVPAQNNRQNLGNSNYSWQTVYTTGLSAGSFANSGAITGQWQLTNNSVLTPFADLSNNLGASTLRFNNVYTSSLNSGLQTGYLKGAEWKLDSGTMFLPAGDTLSMLGAPGQRFGMLHASGFDAGINNAAFLTGEFSVTGSMVPSVDGQYDLGAPGLAWKTLRAKDVQTDNAEVGMLTARIMLLANMDGTVPIDCFDDDPALTADSHACLPTQYAVRTYVDRVKADLLAQINALTSSLNNGLSAFKNVPAGIIMHHAGSTAPDGYLVCDGRSIPTSSYPDLFSAIGYTYGGSGSNFNIPNLLGEFIRGWDAGRGVDPGRNLGSFQTDNIGAHQHDFRDVWMIVDDQSAVVNTNNPGMWGGWNLDGSYGYPARDVNGNEATWFAKSPSGYVYPYDDNYPDDGGSNDNTIWTIANRTAPSGSGSVRPRNVALLPIIKFKNGN